MNEIRSSSESNTKSSEVSRDDVQTFYSRAAVTSQESLCCPADYSGDDLSHIPEEVRSISYGCGSPVSRANLSPGETLVDLGSGGGIDCFIAAKSVGAGGRVYGIDMTDEMLGVARKNAVPVAENLGYSNVEFKQGFLEAIPLEDASADVVTSNCVVNLSTRKEEVFREIHRVLKAGGRFVIADIISEREVPEAMQNRKDLWGECVSGAMTLPHFLDAAKKSGFLGLCFEKDYLWKEVEGIRFYSYTIRGYKLEPGEPAPEASKLLAIYNGPFDSVNFGGTHFEVGVPVAVDRKTGSILGSRAYCGEFTLIDPQNETPAEAPGSCCG
ncbi:MAG: methyltransferase domain-containing protein [Nitrospinaceae bacterium]|jgi:SAM-dependent methyltransferase|nr:MAG: methyltransferase domain-containing protein [Nitrospinaceae bacterium]